MEIQFFTALILGFLHVLSGPDHLAAIAPFAFNGPKCALRNGLYWTIGHSLGLIFLVSLFFSLKSFLDIGDYLNHISHFAEFIVGIALLGIGIFTVKRSLGLYFHSHKHKHFKDISHTHLHLHFRGSEHSSEHHNVLTGLGLLHGIAGGSHIAVVLAALTLPLIGVFWYFLAYIIGAMISMVIVVITLSLTALRLGQKALTFLITTAGTISILTGIFWIQKTSVGFI